MSSTTKARGRLPEWARPKEMIDLVRLALPIAASRASFMLMSLTDAVVLAHKNAAEVPLVLNSWLPNGVFMGFGLGLVLGVSVLTAELNGSGRGAETGRIFRRGLWVSVLYSLFATVAIFLSADALFPLLGFPPELAAKTAEVTRILALGTIGHMIGTVCAYYLEALRKPNLVTAVNMSAVGVNLVSALILVPEYGAVGVVWGTTLSRVYMMVLFLLIVWRLTPAFRASPKGPGGEAKRQNTVGVGTGIANVAEWGSFNLTFIIATLASLQLARPGGDAAYGLAIQVMGVCFMLYVGLGTATSVRVAERYGRGEMQAVKDAGRLGVAAGIVLGLVLGVIIVLARDMIAVGLLSSPEAAHTGGVDILPMLALILAAVSYLVLFDGLQAVGAMAMRAQGVVWLPTCIHVGSYVLVMLPVCWWLALHQGMGVWGVVVGISVASVVAGTSQVIALEWAARRGVRRGPVGAPGVSGH